MNQAINYYEIRNESKLEESIVSNDKNGKPISYFKDNVWDFTKSSLCREDRRSTYMLRFDYKTPTGKLLSEYTDLMVLYKSYIYIQMNRASLQTSITKFFLIRNIFNFFISKNINSLDRLDFKILDEYQALIISSDFSNKKKYDVLTSFKNLISYKDLYTISNKNDLLKHTIWILAKTYNERYEKNQTEVISDIDIKNIIKKCDNIIENSEKTLKFKKYKDELSIHYGLNDPNLKGKERGRRTASLLWQWNDKQKEYKGLKTFNDEVRDIYEACCVIILTFTGMRISECLHLPIDCIKEVDTTCGEEDYKLYYLKSTTFKYEDSESGVSNTDDMRSEWLANETVVNAIKILKKLYKYEYSMQNSDFLFCSVRGSSVCQISQNVMRDRIKVFLNDETMSPHRFRRTFARLVARSAFGEVNILQEQFKHKTKEITEYYMQGDVDLEFLNYIESEQEEIKSSVLWDNLLKKAQDDFGDELINKLNEV